MTHLRKLLRRTAYRTGVLSMARIGVRHALTAVMFHRVIDPSDPDFALADPVYTVSAPLFEQLLAFFHDHYAVVDIHQVLDAGNGIRALPDHALLITFDDGWADNLRYAAPLLKARGMPAVIFVAAEAVQASSPAWWQEEVFAVSRSGGLAGWLSQHHNQARIMGTASNGTADDAVDVVTRLALMDGDVRQSILVSLPRTACHARMMLNAAELRQLADFGIAAAGAVGIKLVFTSDKLLNATQRGMLTHTGPLGRIGITAADIESAPNRLDRAATSRWLWARDCR